jgi:uncharacterized radical SAM protein YgiQ
MMRRAIIKENRSIEGLSMTERFLPVSREDMKRRGWEEPDVVLVSGDAYVDHPAYGVSVIGRVLEKLGFRVGIIAQPDWKSKKDFMRLGRPRYFFGITSGNVDSMVANYTANKKPRKTDDYSPGEKAGMRPDRALIVYTNRVREAFPDVPVVIGGLEASLRRFAHYDYWDDSVRRSVIFDSKADILVYGMGEKQIAEISGRLRGGEDIKALDGIRGTAVIRKDTSFQKDILVIPSYDEVKDSKKKFNEAFRLFYGEQNPHTGRAVAQKHGDRFLVQFPPPLPLSEGEMDAVYEAPYARMWHPSYDASGGIKGFETIKFSVVSHRGCAGECSFCSLYFHQGRIVQSRSESSVLKEIELISKQKYFRGTITDIGGPTANMYKACCGLWEKQGACRGKSCLAPSKCAKFTPGYRQSIELYRKARKIPGVKNVFIGSGFRFDLLADASADAYLEEVCRNHISGQMKVAPEYGSPYVLEIMNKTPFEVYERFVDKYARVNKKLDKDQFLVNYFINAHPGAGLGDALQMGLYFAQRRMHPEQIQDFIPLPMTLSGCIYHTGVHPFTGEKIFTARSFTERKMQRALLQHRNPSNRSLVMKALRELKALHLAGRLLH